VASRLGSRLEELTRSSGRLLSPTPGAPRQGRQLRRAVTALPLANEKSGSRAVPGFMNPEGIVIYSVGPDGKDDGGAAYDNKTKTGDIIFELRK